MNTIDTGLVRFELPFDRGTEEIFFNPNDTGFFVRLKDLLDFLPEKYKEAFEKFNAEGVTKEEQINITRQVNEEICEQFDIAFGNKVSDKIFKWCSPTSVVRNLKMYYPYYFLQMISPDIEKETGEAMAEIQEEIKKISSKHNVEQFKK